MYQEYIASRGVLPMDADSAFILWHEATEAGRPSEILNAVPTPETYLAAHLLYTFAPLKYAPIPPTPQELEEQRIAQVLASGWGQ